MSMRLAATVKLGGGSFYPYGPRYLGYTPDLEPGGGAIGLMGHWRGGGRRGHTAFFGGMDFSFTWADIRNFFSGGGPANGPVFYRPYEAPPQVLDPHESRLSGHDWRSYQHHTSGPELLPEVVPVTMHYMPAGEPPKWRATQQQITGVDLINQPERKVAIPPHMSGVLETNTADLTAPRPERWEESVYGDYTKHAGMHIGNS